MSHNIELEGGKAKRLLTKGKYCDRDIVVTPENLDGNLAQQDSLIEQIKTALQGKTAGGGTVEAVLQEKSVTPTKSAQSVVPDSGYDGLSKVNVGAIPADYVIPSGTKNITENGTHDVKAYESVVVEVPTSGSSDLPQGYRRCDYIQFSGNNFIDTGLIGNQDIQINVLFTWESTTKRQLFGCASSDNLTGITAYMDGTWRFGGKNATKTLAVKNTLLPYCALVDKTTIAITGNSTTITGVSDFQTVGTLLLGGARDADGTLPSFGITGKVFYCNIWQGEEQVLKLVPVTDGTVYRFWDTIGQKFHDSLTSTPLGGGNL